MNTVHEIAQMSEKEDAKRRELATLRARNVFLEEFTPKTNLGLIDVIADLKAENARLTECVERIRDGVMRLEVDKARLIAVIGMLIADYDHAWPDEHADTREYRRHRPAQMREVFP